MVLSKGATSNKETRATRAGASENQPCRSVAELRRRIVRAEVAMARAGNPHALFLTLYKTTTGKAEKLLTILRDPVHPEYARFNGLDPNFLERCVLEFGGKYLHAYDCYATGRIEAVPRPWRVAFEEAGKPNCSPFVAVVLGVNAHVGHDLPAVLALGADRGASLFDPKNASHKRTFRALNGFMLEELPTILKHARRVEPLVMRPWYRAIAAAVRAWHYIIHGGPVSALGARLFVRLRAEAEWHAVQLSRGRMSQAEVERLVLRRALRLRSRDWPLWLAAIALMPSLRLPYLAFLGRAGRSAPNAHPE